MLAVSCLPVRRFSLSSPGERGKGERDGEGRGGERGKKKECEDKEKERVRKWLDNMIKSVR
jgi:hypothetical protein